MGWLNKIFKGSSSSHRISEGRYEDEGIWDALSDFDNEEVECAIALSLVEEDERSALSLIEADKKSAHSSVHEEEEEEEEEEEGSVSSFEEIHYDVVSSPEEHNTGSNSPCQEDPKGKKVIDEDSNLEEDEQLAKVIQESLYMNSPPRKHVECRICAGCNGEIGHGRFFNFMGGVWHPECLHCHACNLPISDNEFSIFENRPFHKSCYTEHHHPKCDVCKNLVPTNEAGSIVYREHPFWLHKYCPTHEHDGTPRCCSCERMEPKDTKYILLDDDRKLCLECLDSSIMDTHECQPLYLEIQIFYEGLHIKIEQQVPLLLVKRQALNEAMEGEKHGHHHMPETRGLCLSEEQPISNIISRPRVKASRIIDTEPYKLVRQCEVTAILILYSLPRLLTGSILAHEMMHAWLRLKGYSNLPPDVEEGICQVLSYMWLDSEIMAMGGSGGTNVASSSSSSAHVPASSMKGKPSHFEKQLGEFFKHQIELNTSASYGDGFREGKKAVVKYGLISTLEHIRLTKRFPG